MSSTHMPYESQPKSGAPIQVSWAGNPWSLAGICLLNILLIVVTLGIYWFWARSEYRRRMWQMVRVNGEPLEYTGTGWELFIGYLKVFFFILFPAGAAIGVAQALLGPKNPLLVVLILALYAGLLVLFFAGVFRANRYILTRTRWRGIALGLGEGALGYAWLSIWSALVTGLTLGWLYPWRATALRRRLTNAMRFGSLPFRFEGSSGSLYGPFVLVWLVFIVGYAALAGFFAMVMQAAMKTSGAGSPDPEVLKALAAHYAPVAVTIFLLAIPLALVAMSWFEVRKLNVFARATKASGLSAGLEAHAGSYIWLIVSNTLIMILSIGILRPVAQARRLRYLVSRFSFTGSANLNEVLRAREEAGTQGAGMEAAFSIEIF
jgi:uncharacterized membrane protein YjgN (DUF898 family)